MSIPLSAKVVTFIHTRDREKAKAFYRDTLGFAFIGDDDFASVFDLNGAQLRITQIDGFAPHGHPVLGWAVADIVATTKALRDRGVKMNIYEGFGQDDLGIWTSPDGHAKVAFFSDPDGNGLSLTSA